MSIAKEVCKREWERERERKRKERIKMMLRWLIGWVSRSLKLQIQDLGKFVILQSRLPPFFTVLFIAFALFSCRLSPTKRILLTTT
jgi:hypothetical protein